MKYVEWLLGLIVLGLVVLKCHNSGRDANEYMDSLWEDQHEKEQI